MGRWRGSLSPLIHWSPSSRNSLEDNPLAVPDAGEVADAVQTAAVRVAGPSHIQHSEVSQSVRQTLMETRLTTYLATAHSEQLPGMDLLDQRYWHLGS